MQLLLSEGRFLKERVDRREIWKELCKAVRVKVWALKKSRTCVDKNLRVGLTPCGRLPALFRVLASASDLSGDRVPRWARAQGPQEWHACVISLVYRSGRIMAAAGFLHDQFTVLIRLSLRSYGILFPYS